MDLWVELDGSGRAVRWATSREPGMDAYAPYGLDLSSAYFNGSEWRDLPPQPDPHHVWDLPSESWVDPRTPEQVAADDAEAVSALWSELRAERDRRLSICDWTQVPDVPMDAEARSAWASYRQALRDLPENTIDPAAPIWPEAPNA